MGLSVGILVATDGETEGGLVVVGGAPCGAADGTAAGVPVGFGTGCCDDNVPETGEEVGTPFGVEEGFATGEPVGFATGCGEVGELGN